MSGTPKVIHSVSITDGRRMLGEVVQLANGQHRAETAAGVSLGIFDHRRDATHAVWLASRASNAGEGE